MTAASLLRLFLALTVICWGAFISPAALAGEDCGFYGDNCPKVTRNGYVYTFDGTTLSRTPVVTETVEKPKVTLEVHYTPACPANAVPGDNGDFGDYLCLNATQSTQCPPNQILFWRYQRVIRSVIPVPPAAREWRQVGDACFGPDRTWSVPDLTASVRERLIALVGEPQISVAPEGRGVVNLPVIVWTQPAQPVGFEITQPVPGEVQATAAYGWNFGTGAQQQGPGRPYDGTSALEHPDYYVASAYETRGAKTITLTRTWTATLTVGGIEIPLDPLVQRVSTNVDVLEARTQLVDDGPG